VRFNQSINCILRRAIAGAKNNSFFKLLVTVNVQVQFIYLSESESGEKGDILPFELVELFVHNQ